MTSKRRQQGVAAGLIAIVIILVIVGMLATALLSRLGRQAGSSDQATVGLDRLADAIEKYVANVGRLPCPADPNLPTTNETWGDEAVPNPNDGTCNFPAGTIPWRTVGARQADAVDPWGRKVSYRVFRGTPFPPAASPGIGSLTQSAGVTMVECDTFEPTSGATTPINPPGGVRGGVCVSNTDATLRTTRAAVFLDPLPLDKKGLRVTDLGQPQKADVAFVLLSHGATGLGGYTIAGSRTPLPGAGPELAHTTADGPFTIQSFSVTAADPAAPGYFDDWLVYRTLPDLVTRTNLGPRNWPEPLPPGSTTLTFDATTVGAAVGSPVSPGSSTGSVSVTFTGVVATGAGSSGAQISLGNAGGYTGLGVAGGGSMLLESTFAESLTFQFSTNTNRQFAITLGDFGRYGDAGRYIELALFSFYNGATPVDTKVGVGCRVDGGLASFQMSVASDFNRVVVSSFTAFDVVTASLSGLSAFLIAEIAACPASAIACVTSLTDFGNLCSVL